MEQEQEAKLAEIELELADQQAIEEFDAQLDRIETEVQENHDVMASEATRAFGADSRVKTIRTQIMPRVRQAYLDYEKSVADGRARLEAGILGQEGLEEVEASAARTRDAKILEQRNHVEDTSKFLREQYTGTSYPQPTPETLAEIQTGHLAFGNKTGRQLLGEAIEGLRQAQAGGGMRALHLLEQLHAPLCERMSTQPPRHAKRYQGSFRRLNAAISKHLDTAKRGPKARLAQGFGDQARREFDFLVVTARESGSGWDDTICGAATEVFNWPEKGLWPENGGR